MEITIAMLPVEWIHSLKGEFFDLNQGNRIFRQQSLEGSIDAQEKNTFDVKVCDMKIFQIPVITVQEI